MKSYTSKWYQTSETIIKYIKKMFYLCLIFIPIFIVFRHIFLKYGEYIYEFIVKNPSVDTSIVAVIISIASPIISWWYRKKNKEHSNIVSTLITNNHGELGELKISFINPSKINDYVRIKNMFIYFKDDEMNIWKDSDVFYDVCEYHKNDWFQWHSIKSGEITYMTIISLEDNIKKFNIIQNMIDKYNSEGYQKPSDNRIIKNSNYRFCIEYETINDNNNIKTIWMPL